MFPKIAMTFLKLKDWQNAESDASSAIKLDKFHVKSYQRRSAARLALGKVRASLRDLNLAKEALKQSNKVTGIGTIDDNKKMLQTCDVKTHQIEAELRRIVQSAPKRNVKIQIQKPMKTVNSPKEDEIEQCAIRDLNHGKEREINQDCSFQLSNMSSSNSKKTRVISQQNVKNWLQFESVWRTLLSSQKIELLKSMNPCKLTQIYKHGLEDSALLVDLLHCCSKMKKFGFSYLKALSQIPSIDMVVMMLSSKDKEKISAYIDEILKGCDEDNVAVRNCFGISNHN